MEFPTNLKAKKQPNKKLSERRANNVSNRNKICDTFFPKFPFVCELFYSCLELYHYELLLW